MEKIEIQEKDFNNFFETYKNKSISPKIKCAIFGGLGNPKHSVIALYAEYLSKIKSHVEFIGVDILVEVESKEDIVKRKDEIYEKIGINYTKVYSPEKYYELLIDNNFDVDIVFILTPVSTHFEILQNFHGSKNLCFVVEKPTCSIEEGKKDFFEFVNKLENAGNVLYLIDTTLVSYSLDYFIKNNLRKELGQIQKIQVIGLDNPWEIEENICEYSFLFKIDAINERGLLKCNQNGGAGLGFDMGIHGVAALMRLLDALEKDIKDFELQKVILEAIDIEELNRDKGIESYMLLKGKLQNIDIIIEGGKGSDIWDRRIEIYGSEKIIVIGFGTLLHKNYIAKMSNDEVLELFVFDTKDTGYENHMKDIIRLIFNEKNGYILSPEKSIEYMKNAMKLMNKIYSSVDENLSKREDKIIKLKSGPHKNIFITEEQELVRNRLKEIQNKHLFIKQSSFK